MSSRASKILIVDDDADFLESVSSFLVANGYTVVRASNGRDGLKLAKMEHPDLIIMDIMMSERTEGFFTIQDIRHVPELQTVPIFVVSSIYSSVTGFRVAPDGGWIGHDEFLSKPVDPPELLDKIRRRIGEPGPT